jgi:hypothetical protein
MKTRSWSRYCAFLLLTVLLAACQATPTEQVILSTKPPLELRAMQSRIFDTSDKGKTLRAVVATLQDLGYSIDKIEPAAATVSATKLSLLRMSVAIYPRGEQQLVVRSNALVIAVAGTNKQNQVDDPAFYQQRFFEPLSKAMFLSALQIEDKDDVPVPQPAK